jgi:hypothetical protein
MLHNFSSNKVATLLKSLHYPRFNKNNTPDIHVVLRSDKLSEFNNYCHEYFQHTMLRSDKSETPDFLLAFHDYQYLI